VHFIPIFLKYLDGQIIGQCMVSTRPVSGELLVWENVESDVSESEDGWQIT